MVKRRYDGESRRLAGRRTRGAILEAAASLFVSPGYAATRLPDLAQRAGVAVPTIHAHFGSKKGVLAALLDVTVAGDDEPVPLAERDFAADISAMTDARDMLARYAEHLVGVHERLADIELALRAAATADADAAAIRAKNDAERRAGMGMFAAALRAGGDVRPDISQDELVDVLFLAMDVAGYDWLVRRRGWSAQAYRRWYVDSVAGAVLRRPDAAEPPSI